MVYEFCNFGIPDTEDNTDAYPSWAMFSIYSEAERKEFRKNKLEQNSISVEALLEKIYTITKKMLFACPNCDSANAIGNPTCCQCGAPLGSLYRQENL